MQFKDYYKILGINSDADLKSIKTAYRKLARKFHPDVSEDKDAEEKFKEIAEAYAVLKDKDKRAEFDEIRQYGQHGKQFTPPPGWQPNASAQSFDFSDGEMSDFFSSLFGQSQRQSRSDFNTHSRSQQTRHQRGRDLEIEMPIFLEDTINGESKSLNYEMPHHDAYGRVAETIKKNLQVKIPKGVQDGERIRLKGQGAPGIGDALSGDLYLHIRLVPHPLYDVEGHNLIITVPIAPWEAALGKAITIPTITGKIKLQIPKNSQTGQRLRIKGRGLPGKNIQGDLYALLKVVMPTDENVERNGLWKTMSQSADFDPRSDWS